MTNNIEKQSLQIENKEIIYDEKLLQEINELSNTELLLVNKSITQLAYNLRALLGKSETIMQSMLNCIEDKNIKNKCQFIISNFHNEINDELEKGSN